MQTYENITIALAGILQASFLINELAFKGQTQDTYFETCIYSLYQIDAPDVVSIYKDLKNLHLGLEEIISLFDKGKKKLNPHVGRYAWSAILLERQLNKRADLQTEIKKRIE